MEDGNEKPAAPAPAGPTPPGRQTATRPESDAGKISGKPAEFGGPAGPEPTRYGDWERNGRVSDF